MPLDLVLATAQSLTLPPAGVRAALSLLGGGATVPFVARYRKEATGGLDEVQLRAVEERHRYLQELEERRALVLAELEKQGKLTPALRAAVAACTQKAELEDIYLPFKPKRRTRAQLARERGLEPLALRILAQPPSGAPAREAEAYVDADKGVADAGAALAGARDIVAELVAERAPVRAFVRELFTRQGVLTVRRGRGQEGPTKFEAYYDYAEPLSVVPSHRFLAVQRGEQEGVLSSQVVVDEDLAKGRLETLAGVRAGSPFAASLREAVHDGYARLLAPSLESEARTEARQRAEVEAIAVFAKNLRSLLLASPLGARPVLGIDPGQRTGCKVAVVDATGGLQEHAVLYLVQGEAALAQSRRQLLALVARHRPAAIAVGNGTHGRETEAFVREVLSAAEALGEAERPCVVSVNEAGASVYSASETAREELGDVDLTVRGAVSIARRLQDPLAELVKVEPRAIGVGQYQHDLPQARLCAELDGVVESCVNQVGVDVNTASPHLLGYVAGIGPTLAKKLVAHRTEKGPFRSRKALLAVPGLGPRTFEQAAGFLRVRGGDQPLDASAVHPERYAVVQAMARELGVEVGALVGDGALAARIEWQRYVGEGLGEPTLRDILAELERPGRDPRATFEPPRFRDDVRALEDLSPGMSLEGVVTNVTAFGAFVDVGVHQDGLVHVSQLANRFVRDPAEVVKPGDRLTVRVLQVDPQRRRISLSARTDGGGARPAPSADAGGRRGERGERADSGPGQGRPPASKADPARPAPSRPGSGASSRPPLRSAPPPAAPPAPTGALRHSPFERLGRK